MSVFVEMRRLDISIGAIRYNLVMESPNGVQDYVTLGYYIVTVFEQVILSANDCHGFLSKLY